MFGGKHSQGQVSQTLKVKEAEQLVLFDQVNIVVSQNFRSGCQSFRGFLLAALSQNFRSHERLIEPVSSVPLVGLEMRVQSNG